MYFSLICDDPACVPQRTLDFSVCRILQIPIPCLVHVDFLSSLGHVLCQGQIRCSSIFPPAKGPGEVTTFAR